MDKAHPIVAIGVGPQSYRRRPIVPREPGGKALLASLTPEQRATLEACLEAVDYPAGSLVFTQGEPGDSVLFVDDGLIRLEIPQAVFEEDLVLTYIEPGELLGELSMIDERPRASSAYAHRDTRCRVLTREQFSALCAQDPALGLAITRGVARQVATRLRETNVRLQTSIVRSTSEAGVDAQVARANTAQAIFMERWAPEEEADALLRAISDRLLEEHRALAEEAVRETGLGDPEHKAHKNRLACEGILALLEGRPAFGELGRDGDLVEFGSPAGVVFGIVPITNPVSNAIFKILVSLKTRNSLILSFHRAAVGVGTRTVGIVREALRAQGAPEDLVQVVEGRTSRRQTQQFMRHPGVALILATGGRDLVKAAYSSGTPALGVGAGNAPAWICADADPDRVARDVVASKTYDNGIICGSEHNLVVDREMVQPLVAALERHGAAVLGRDERRRALGVLLEADQSGLRRALLGKPAAVLAEVAGVVRPGPIRLIVVPAGLDRLGTWMSREKLAPLLSLFPVDGDDQALAVCLRILGQQGAGHTAVLHTHDPLRIRRFAAMIPAGRLLLNTPATQGMLGVTTGLPLSFMLGCGTFGGNTTTDAINFRHLLNVKRLAPGRPGPA